jgi:L-glyceraldehyde 3-phosphate reductase
MGALHSVVQQGKALYVGISSYSPEQTRKAVSILADLGTPAIIHQPAYSMFNRWVEDGLLDTLDDLGLGSIAFSPLAQGLLTDRYLDGIPEGSRAAMQSGFADSITDDRLDQIRRLNEIASARQQSLAQLAVAWVLRGDRVTSALIGASSVEQLEDTVASLDRLDFTDEELRAIEDVLG